MKKQKSFKNKVGFSLIELSIVILIIGILVIGVTKGTAIMTKARLASSRALTSSSPALQISDLFVWYESTLDSSFGPSDAFDGTSLTNAGGGWIDNSPAKGSANNAQVGVVAPTYVENGINGLPSVSFASAARLTFNSSFLNQKDYTIFVVEQKRAATEIQRFLNLGNTAGTNAFGYGSNTTVTGTTGTVSATVTGLVGTSYQSRVVTFLSDSSNATPTTARRVFVNGTVGGTTADATTRITVGATSMIGADGSAFANPYTGYISEIIIFNRGLKADERNDIQGYLSKKYNIKVTQSS